MGIVIDKDEEVILIERKHWFVFMVETLSLLIVLFAPLLLIFASNLLSVSIEFNKDMMIFIGFFYLVWLFIIWNGIFIVWTDYFLDVLVVTNKRLIDIDQRGLFKREVSTLHLSKIQDVTSEVHGVIPTFLKFGDLHIQTAGAQREFTVKDLNNPVKVRQAASEVIEKYKDGQMRNDEE